MMLEQKSKIRHHRMTCACSNRIEKVLNKTEGIQHATVNLTTEQALVSYYPNAINTIESFNVFKIGLRR